MKNLVLLFALFVVFTTVRVQAAPCVGCATESFILGGDESSVMVLNVSQVKGSEKKAHKLKESLLKVEGITDVDINVAEGTVKVVYEKSKIGCCSRITSTVKSAGCDYKVVSNDEKGAGNGACSGSKKSCPSENKCCSKKSKES
ncbi:MAG: hypothetical protein LC115_07535 [Bacteroidia bacterium]|nr:hypothetical protein [Bacteroidia bacterium]